MVFEAADEKAAVYKVEFLGVCPVVFDIVDFEGAITWNTAFVRITSSIPLTLRTSLAGWDLGRCL